MKLILSGGGSGKQTKELDKKFANLIDKEKPLLYIPIAIDNCKRPYPGCLEWLRSTFDNLGITKYEMITEKELGKYSKKDPSEFGGIYIGRGNTPYLLKKLKESGMWQFLEKALEQDVPIYGGSAGAIIFGKSIKPSLHMDKNWVDLEDLEGMNVLKGKYIFCHVSPEKKEEDKIKNLAIKNNTLPAILLS